MDTANLSLWVFRNEGFRLALLILRPGSLPSSGDAGDGETKHNASTTLQLQAQALSFIRDQVFRHSTQSLPARREIVSLTAPH